MILGANISGYTRVDNISAVVKGDFLCYYRLFHFKKKIKKNCRACFGGEMFSIQINEVWRFACRMDTE